MGEKTDQSKRSSAYSKLLDPATLVLVVAVGAALYFLVSYSRANVALSKENERLSAYAKAEPGDAVPPFQSVDLQGRRYEVSYNTPRKHLLFIFTAGCGACLEQLPVWSRVAAEVNADEYSVHVVSLDKADDTAPHFDGKYQNLPVVLAPSPVSFMRTYRVNGFPQVMVVSGQGIVEWVHVGKLSDDKLQELTSKVGRAKT